VSAARAAVSLAREEPLTPVQYAMLGLLRAHAAHGYELQRSFAAGSDLGGVVHVEQASLYGALKDLAGRGLIEGAEAREGLRPPRTVYSLSPRGERVLDAWMRTPVERLRQVRLDFLLKVYFARRRGEAAVRALVDEQIATCHRYLADLEARAAELAPRGDLYVRLAQVQLVQEDYAKAAHSLRKALDKGGLVDKGGVELLLGITYFNEKKLDEARSWFARAQGSPATRKQAQSWIEHVDRELDKGDT